MMYLIVGGSGFLGRYLIKNILDVTNYDVVATFSNAEPPLRHPRLSWHRLDVCDVAAVRALHNKVGDAVKVIYLAAYHHPDKVAANPEIAWEHNIIALANFVNIFCCAHALYYSSTDSVYGDGSSENKFTEDSALHPVNLYGRHKVLAEQITLTKDFNVVRFPFIFGPSLVEAKQHFFDILKAELTAGKPIEMFADSYRSTLSFDQCASLLVRVMELPTVNPEKILNIASDEVLSKYDVGLRLAQKYGLDESLVKGISVKGTSQIFTAKRAETALLDNTKLKQLLHLSHLNYEV